MEAPVAQLRKQSGSPIPLSSERLWHRLYQPAPM